MSNRVFFRRALIFVGVAIVPLLLWYLSDALLIAFGAILLAMVLRIGSEPLRRFLRLPEGVALIFSGLLMLLAVGGTGFIFGSHIAEEFKDVLHRISEAEQGIFKMLHESALGSFLANQAQGSNVPITEILSRALSLSTTLIEVVVVLVVGAGYLAAQPGVYRDGLVMLFPPRHHEHVGEVLDDLAAGLRLWLLGQFIQMLLIGVLSAVATWLIGLSSPLALGLIAGMAEFVPYLGPILAAIPALLVAVTKSPEAVLWTLVAYVLIHQIEGNLVVPLVQRQLLTIPPALILLAIIVNSVLFGTVGFIFAAPIAVAVFIGVKKVWVRDTLGEATEIPGEARLAQWRARPREQSRAR